MKWKSFDEEMPSLLTYIILRSKTNMITVSHSMVKRPYDINPKKYNENYYMIRFHDWLELCESIIEEYEWLDPFEDRKKK